MYRCTLTHTSVSGTGVRLYAIQSIGGRQEMCFTFSTLAYLFISISVLSLVSLATIFTASSAMLHARSDLMREKSNEGGIGGGKRSREKGEREREEGEG